MSDWFRKQTWTEQDENDFYAHLARSRSEYHKSQYLRIQAITFYELHDEKYYDVILSLLDKYFNDFPNEQFFRCECLHLYGRVFYDREQLDKAFEYYQKAAYQELKHTGVISGAWLDYAQIIIQLEREDYYDEAIKIIQSYYDSRIFPIEIYRSNAILAVIYNYFGDKEKACDYRKLAREAASMKKNALRHNSDIGLVEKRDTFLEKAMDNITL